MDSIAISGFVDSIWDEQIVPQLVDYIRIPNKSPMFDADWQANGHMEKATQQLAQWAEAQDIPGKRVEIIRLGNRTPLILVEIDGEGDDEDDPSTEDA